MLPQETLLLGWFIVLAAAVAPWHRLPRAVFGSVALAAAGTVALLVSRTRGPESPYQGLFYLTALVGAVVAPPLWAGVAIGTIMAGLNLLPLTYSPGFAAEQHYVRSGLLIIESFFGAWLVDELSRVVVVASLDRRRLGEEREVAAELRRAQAMRQEYMSVIAHELRNPLVAVGAAARVLAKDVVGKPGEQIANGIVVEVRHALDLLDGLTDVSSLESGRLRIVLRPTELTALQGVAPDHNMVLRGAEAPITVLAERGQRPDRGRAAGGRRLRVAASRDRGAPSRVARAPRARARRRRRARPRARRALVVRGGERGVDRGDGAQRAARSGHRRGARAAARPARRPRLRGAPHELGRTDGLRVDVPRDPLLRRHHRGRARPGAPALVFVLAELGPDLRPQ
ncbi:MAG: hypothetical protein FJ034_05395 [Chloroflexi bacterium]|nr:hypothetical protein [Chloroflexota bacterium]